MAQRQQFLNFDKPEFVDDFVYTPPFEMMEKALKVNQEGADKAAEIVAALVSAPLFGALDEVKAACSAVNAFVVRSA